MSIVGPLLTPQNKSPKAFEDGIGDQFWTRYAFLLLIGGTLAIDFLTPYLIKQRLLPHSIRYLGDITVLSLFALMVLRAIVFDRIPYAFLVVIAISIIWGVVATFEGQPLLATFWGWWRLFKFPVMGLMTYLQPFWPDDFSEKIRLGAFWMFAANLGLQFVQYATGEVPGDHLAGFFGRNGVAPLMMFVIFNLSIAFARWLALGKWDMLIYVIPMAAIASGLGEMKMFPFLLVALGTFTFILQLLRGYRYQELFLYAIFIVLATLAFGVFYNIVVADARGTRRIEEYLEPDTITTYLNQTYQKDDGSYYIGRGFALKLGWQTIQRDGTTLMFGMGLGSRGESVTLGVAGSGLTESVYGIVAGSSLLVLMQELGLVGLGIFGGIAFWILFTLWTSVLQRPDSPHNTLRLAIILQTIMWPILIWYSQTWLFAVFMSMYWGSVGYLLGYAKND